MISGARTCTDDQGNAIPAQVTAMIQEVVLPMMSVFPLCRKFSSENKGWEMVCAYIQSTACNVSFSDTGGLRSLRNIETTTKAMPQRGRLRSAR